MMIQQLIVYLFEVFHIKTPNCECQQLAVDFFTHSQMFYLCTHNYLRVLVLLSQHEACNTLQKKIARHSQHHSSDLYLEWSFAKISRIIELCQGKYFLEHFLGFDSCNTWNRFLSIDHILVPGIMKVPITITLDYRGRRRLTRMHTILLWNLFSSMSFAIVLIPLFLLSR